MQRFSLCFSHSLFFDMLNDKLSTWVARFTFSSFSVVVVVIVRVVIFFCRRSDVIPIILYKCNNSYGHENHNFPSFPIVQCAVWFYITHFCQLCGRFYLNDTKLLKNPTQFEKQLFFFRAGWMTGNAQIG